MFYLLVRRSAVFLVELIHINDSFTVQRGTEFNLFGGSVARLLMAIDGSEVNVAGGEIPGDFELGEGAILECFRRRSRLRFSSRGWSFGESFYE